MTRRSLLLIALMLALLSAACGRRAPADPIAVAEPSPAATTAPATTAPATTAPATTAPATTAPTTVAPTATPSATRHTPPATPAPTRAGSDYVLRLPREDAVPAGWAMSPLPDFQSRAPQPGDTYRFACRDLPARSVGIATVGYRHLDGLPSVAIEYVIYPTAGDATAALADMRAATAECGEFGLAGGTTAAFSPLAFEPLGDEHLAAALTSSGQTSGELLTHVVKVRQGHVIIGVSHSAPAGEAPPDDALTRALLQVAIDNLRDIPPPPVAQADSL